MSKILENKYGFIRYRQGDHSDEYASIAMPEFQPALSLDRKKVFSQPQKNMLIGLTKAFMKKLNLRSWI